MGGAEGSPFDLFEFFYIVNHNSTPSTPFEGQQQPASHDDGCGNEDDGSSQLDRRLVSIVTGTPDDVHSSDVCKYIGFESLFDQPNAIWCVPTTRRV